MKRIVCILLALVMFLSSVSALVSCESNDTPQTEPKKITLTTQNFDDYFAYEVTGGAYSTDKQYITYDGEIIFTFYPLKNIEVQNCTIRITLEHDYSQNTVAIPKNYEPREVKVPYDGKLTVTFTGVSYYNRWGHANKDVMKIKIEPISGTIIEK